MSPRVLPVFMLALCVLGCDRPSTETVSACKSLQRSFGLNDDERKKCLREPDYRKDLQTKRERYYSETITTTHNRDRTILALRGSEVSTFAPIEKMSELPVSILGLGEAAKVHVGKRYVIAATVSVLPSFESGEAPSIFVHGLKDVSKDRGFEMAGSHALNEYQKTFLADHCALSEGTSLCNGRVYLEIMQDSKGLFIGPQMVGAEFEEARAQQVFDQIQETHRLADEARQKGGKR